MPEVQYVYLKDRNLKTVITEFKIETIGQLL